MLRHLAFLTYISAAIAQQPPISNADLQTASASGGLEQAIRTASSKSPMWIGYAVPKVPGDGQSCCWNNDSRGCGLEGQRNITVGANGSPIKLEGPTHIAILLRIEQGNVGKIRSFSVDCPLDAGGLPFVWLTNVKPTESVVMLSRQAGEAGTDKIRDQAMVALAQSAEPSAAQSLIRIAKENSSAHVRGQALFWLAQRASREAAGAITESIERDPNTEVKKKAVFALTQLPKDEGVPLLIQVARNNNNPAVRKQAMFWLGQSKDPRALKFFEDVLGR